MTCKYLPLALSLLFGSCASKLQDRQTFAPVSSLPTGQPSALANSSPVLAFPDAEGNGKWAKGGRGGEVCHVLNLADNGPGSLRSCLGQNVPRTVVFAVGGTITLESPLMVSYGRLTLAGQTAPGGGITLRGYEVLIAADDVIVQHMRFRAGDIRKKRCPDTGGRFTEDSFTISGKNIMVDHVSASWGIDECLSGAPTLQEVTVQYSIMAEGLAQTGLFHGECATDMAPGGERRHSMGSLFKPKNSDGNISIHHNLYAHNDNRNPAIGTYEETQSFFADIRNNVLYNTPHTGYTSGKSRAIHVNFIGNVLLFGPDSQEKTIWRCNPPNHVTIFQSDNRRDLNRNGVFDGVNDGWEMFETCDTHSNTPFPMTPVATHSAEMALDMVLAQAGATPWNRDAVDKRIVASVYLGSGRIIDSQEQVGGWPALLAGTSPVDKDRDGMPDDWEIKHGTNPNLPDHNSDSDGDGYTELELYLYHLGHPK